MIAPLISIIIALLLIAILILFLLAISARDTLLRNRFSWSANPTKISRKNPRDNEPNEIQSKDLSLLRNITKESEEFLKEYER